MAEEIKRLVVVGSCGVGKTTLLTTYSTGAFSEVPPSELFDPCVLPSSVLRLPFSVGLQDTNGSAEYDKLRPLTYVRCDVLVVCFSISSRESFTAMTDKWLPEILHHAPHVPFILCGTKADLRNSSDALGRGQSCVSEEEGRTLADGVGARAYVECSALADSGVEDAFRAAYKTLQTMGKRASDKRCMLL